MDIRQEGLIRLEDLVWFLDDATWPSSPVSTGLGTVHSERLSSLCLCSHILPLTLDVEHALIPSPQIKDREWFRRFCALHVQLECVIVFASVNVWNFNEFHAYHIDILLLLSMNFGIYKSFILYILHMHFMNDPDLFWFTFFAARCAPCSSCGRRKVKWTRPVDLF